MKEVWVEKITGYIYIYIYFFYIHIKIKYKASSPYSLISLPWNGYHQQFINF